MPIIAAQTAIAGPAGVGTKTASPTRADAIFRRLDTDGNGALSAQEFQAGYADMRRLVAVEVRLHEQFRLVDADHDGAINAAEYANLVLVKRAAGRAPSLAAFDADHGGSLDFAEYIAAIRRLSALRPPAAAPAKQLGAVPQLPRMPD
jgi:Ca2+-binding EF-hand superfamily protein